MWERFQAGDPNGLDWLIATSIAVVAIGGACMIASYAKGLRRSPRELYLVLFTKLTEYSAYGAGTLAFVLYLNHDVGLGDVAAGSFIGFWMVAVLGVTVVVGAVCDAIGVKRTLLVGCVALLIGRFSLPLVNDFALAVLFGFVPLAIGIAITGPVLLVAVKKYTTEASAALAFALFISLMNLAFAFSGWLFDFVRGIYGDFSVVASLPVVGEISVYQFIIGVGFALTLPDLVAIALMRDNVEMGEDGVRFVAGAATRVRRSLAAIRTAVAAAVQDTGRMLAGVMRERRFWVFIAMLATTAFVRVASMHFLITFPTYGIRLLGDGAKVGNLYAVLNPIIIVLLTPLIAVWSARVRSSTMLFWGFGISALSIWLAVLPATLFAPLVAGGFGELILVRWLDLAIGQWDPFYLVLVTFIAIFSVGEAIWSPRLLQFTVELAPSGKEGSYIALSYLPFFTAQLLAGPMSGVLLATYVPEGQTSYPDHQMVWVWIALLAAFTPLSMMLLRRLFWAQRGASGGRLGRARRKGTP